MKTINIVLATTDLDYGEALSRSLQLYNRYFSIRLTKSAPSEDIIGNRSDYDILLTDQFETTAPRIVYLTSDPDAVKTDERKQMFSVYKYQPASQIAAILRLAHSSFSKTEIVTDETEQTNIVCIGSSSGGSGCTAIALAICQELVRFHGKIILYISLEEFESTADYFPAGNQETNNISRYLYSILKHPDEVKITPQGYMLQDDYGIKAFHPAKGRNPLRELLEGEFGKFITHITKEKCFSHIVIDCGNGFDNCIRSAFRLSKTIVHVEGKSTCDTRQKSYINTVASCCGGLEADELLNVRNFYLEPEENDLSIEQDTTIKILTIEEDPGSFEVLDGRRFISLDKAFGAGIREIADRLK